jgi:hypothetical protein
MDKPREHCTMTSISTFWDQHKARLRSYIVSRVVRDQHAVDYILPEIYRSALMLSKIEEMLQNAVFRKIRVAPKEESKAFIGDWAPGSEIADYVMSATIEAIKI